MSKSSYREYFAECKSLIKFSRICELAGVHRVSFSRFMKGKEFDWCLSVESLQKIYDTLQDELQKLT